jgi:hypothetical protein
MYFKIEKYYLKIIFLIKKNSLKFFRFYIVATIKMTSSIFFIFVYFISINKINLIRIMILYIYIIILIRKS